MKGLVVKPYLLTLVVFWGVMTPGKWESRLGMKVHTSIEYKTDKSAVLMVTSGPDPHMMSNLESHGPWRRNLVEVATSCMGGMAIPCWLGWLSLHTSLGLNPGLYNLIM